MRINSEKKKSIDLAEAKLGTDDPVWTRGTCLVMAQKNCAYCYGIGKRQGRHELETVCNCVLRAVFRHCHNRYRHLRQFGYGEASSVTFQFHAKHTPSSGSTSNGTRSYGLGSNTARRGQRGNKKAEYIADFELIAKRTLDTLGHLVFKHHFVEGLEWRACCRILKMNRGDFFHEVYRLQQKLGRAFAEVRPCALYPTDEYFSPNVAREYKKPQQTEAKVIPTRPRIRTIGKGQSVVGIEGARQQLKQMVMAVGIAA